MNLLVYNIFFLKKRDTYRKQSLSRPRSAVRRVRTLPADIPHHLLVFYPEHVHERFIFEKVLERVWNLSRRREVDEPRAPVKVTDGKTFGDGFGNR